MVMLGGYSVTGYPVSVSPQTPQDLQLLDRLVKFRKEVARSQTHKASASHQAWLTKFMGTGSDIDHEAFLALWLSRFVFPFSIGITISVHVLSIAIFLAKGAKIALAPAVLATLYRDLSLMSNTLFCALANNSLPENRVKTCSPLQLLQVWVWERFPGLSPVPKPVQHWQPRFARWDNLTRVNIQNVMLAINSASRNFVWRPFAATAANDDNSPLPYDTRENYVAVNTMDEKHQSWALCVRVSELVGLGESNIEAYLPHGVAMQFGMDQDITVHVERDHVLYVHASFKHVLLLDTWSGGTL